MTEKQPDIEFAIEVFVRGHCAVKSRTHPYEPSRFGPVWLMRDAPRRDPRKYRKEEWIAHGVDAADLDALARGQARGRFFVCVILAEGEALEPVKAAYKALGYRLLATEGFFVHDLRKLAAFSSPASIEQVRTPELAARYGRATRSRPIPDNLLGKDAPFRQYVALDGQQIIGRVRSVDAAGATSCCDMHVDERHRRQGIGRALLARMLRDDRKHGSKCSVLTATHAGGLLYPRVGYRRIGTLLMFAPSRT